MNKTEGEASISPIFSKPIYSKFTDVDTKKIVPMLKKYVFYDEHNNTEADVTNKSFISNSNHVLEENRFKFLKDKIMKEFYLYASDVMKYTNKFEITTSWFTKSIKGQSSYYHNHNNCMMSGVLYLQTNENSGDIGFQDYNNRRYSVHTKEWNIFNSSIMRFKPADGFLLIFPAEVHHTIEENKSDITRYSLVFNVMPTGLIGEADTDSHMKIKMEKCDCNKYYNYRKI